MSVMAKGELLISTVSDTETTMTITVPETWLWWLRARVAAACIAIAVRLLGGTSSVTTAHG